MDITTSRPGSGGPSQEPVRPPHIAVRLHLSLTAAWVQVAFFHLLNDGKGPEGKTCPEPHRSPTALAVQRIQAAVDPLGHTLFPTTPWGQSRGQRLQQGEVEGGDKFFRRTLEAGQRWAGPQDGRW